MTERFEKFKELLVEWSNDVGYHSFTKQRQKHKNFKEILSLGTSDDLIGYACLCLEGPGSIHEIFSILYELVDIVDQPPFHPYYAGRVPVIMECWKYWALETGFVNSKYDPNAYWVEDKEGNRGDWH